MSSNKKKSVVLSIVLLLGSMKTGVAQAHTFDLDPSAYYFEFQITTKLFFKTHTSASQFIKSYMRVHTERALNDLSFCRNYYPAEFQNGGEIVKLLQSAYIERSGSNATDPFDIAQCSLDDYYAALKKSYPVDYTEPGAKGMLYGHGWSQMRGFTYLQVTIGSFLLLCNSYTLENLSIEDLSWQALLKGSELIHALDQAGFRAAFDAFKALELQHSTAQMQQNLTRNARQHEAQMQREEAAQQLALFQNNARLSAAQRMDKEADAGSQARIALINAQAKAAAEATLHDAHEAQSERRQKEEENRLSAMADAVRKVMSDRKAIGTVGLGIGGTSALYFLSRYGIPLLLKEKPSTVTETSLPENLYQKIFGKEQQLSRLADMVYNPELHEEILALILKNQKAIQHKEPLNNLLFYGPPGTGKTLAAKEIARNSGAEYIVMSGSDLIQLPIEEALQELKKLFIYAKTSPGPVVILVDEADSLFPHRHVALEINRKLTNMFLTMVEKPNHPKFQFIFATNLPRDLDTALLSRVSKTGTLRFDPPQLETREKLLRIYLEKFAVGSTQILTLSEGLMSALQSIAQKLEGWVGRDIEQLVLDVLGNVKFMGRDCVTVEDFLSTIEKIKSHAIQ